MKKQVFLLILFIGTICSAQSQNAKHLKKTEDIGPYVFNVITKLNTITNTEYINSFLTLTEFKEYMLNIPDSITKNANYKTFEISTDDFEQTSRNQLTAFKKAFKDTNVDLSKLTYKNYTYRENPPSDDFPMTTIDGYMIFTHKKEKYKIFVSALSIDNVYIPMFIMGE